MGSKSVKKWPADFTSHVPPIYSHRMSDEMRFLEPEHYVQHADKIFRILRDCVGASLPNAEIEHIGSSAIRGAISKGDLDMLVRVSGADFETAINKMKALGFSEKVGTLRTASLCMLETTEFKIDVAIQLIVRGSEFEDFIRFRDRLNSDQDLVQKYNQLKRGCSGMTAAEYRAVKSEFIQAILEKS